MNRAPASLGGEAPAGVVHETALKALTTGTRSFELIELAGLRPAARRPQRRPGSLARAYDVGARDYGFLEPDPMFAQLVADPAFRALIDRMKADVAAQRTCALERGLLDPAPLIAIRK